MDMYGDGLERILAMLDAGEPARRRRLTATASWPACC